jgi:hypothetical protein
MSHVDGVDDGVGYGVRGSSESEDGVRGRSNNGYGMSARSVNSHGVVS